MNNTSQQTKRNHGMIFALVLALLGVLGSVQAQPNVPPVARDFSSFGNAFGTSLTFSHTCTGSNLGLFVYITSPPSDGGGITNVTYNGVSMTQLSKVHVTDGGMDFWCYWYGLFSPEIGTHNIVVNGRASGWISSVSISYTGVNQTPLPDGIETADIGSNSVGSITLTINTAADQSWAIMGLEGNSTIQHPNAGTGDVYVSSAVNPNMNAAAVFDSGQAISPQGNYSMTVTFSPAQRAHLTGISFAPIGRPLIIGQPTGQTVAAGSNATFTVSAANLPVSYQWRFNHTNLISETNSSLTLTNTTWDQTGPYSVVVSNSFGWVVSSNAILVVVDPTDTDGDGIPNYWELLHGFNPFDPSDAALHPVVGGTTKRLSYLQIYLYGLDPTTLDTDGDGISDYDEIFVYHSNPLSASTACDGIPDWWKIKFGLSPSLNGTNTQVGTTGVTYLQIYQYDTNNPNNQLDPRSTFFAPGTSIYEALHNGQHTNRYYYDREDRLVGVEYSRGVSIAYTNDGNGNLVRQAVLSRAAETNGLPVLWRFLNGLSPTDNSGTNAPYADADGDGWSNYAKWLLGLNSFNSNSVPTNAPNSTPVAILVPTNVLAAQANVPIVMFNALGNPSIPYLQYQFPGSTNWHKATILSVDSTLYGTNLRVTAWPTGTSHALVWDALGDLGYVVTNVLLQAQAMDVEMTGAWSSPPVTYAVNTLPPFQINSGPASLQMTVNGFQFQILGLNGAGPIVVYASTNLIDWTAIFTNPAFIGTVPFIDPAATNLPWRFYKVSEQ